MTPFEQARVSALVGRIDELNAEVARLRRLVAQQEPRFLVPSISRLIAAVAAEFDVTERAILSPRRDAAFVTARQVAMHLAVTQLCKPLPTIGRCLQRDHTTVLYGSRAIAARIATDPALAARVARVAASIEPQETAP